MAVRRLDVATRKEMLSRISQEKRAPSRKGTDRQRKDSAGLAEIAEQDRRWKPLIMSAASNSTYLCLCRDVKRGYANVCPAHMLTFQLAESVH